MRPFLEQPQPLLLTLIHTAISKVITEAHFIPMISKSPHTNLLYFKCLSSRTSVLLQSLSCPQVLNRSVLQLVQHTPQSHLLPLFYPEHEACHSWETSDFRSKFLLICSTSVMICALAPHPQRVPYLERIRGEATEPSTQADFHHSIQSYTHANLSGYPSDVLTCCMFSEHRMVRAPASVPLNLCLIPHITCIYVNKNRTFDILTYHSSLAQFFLLIA